MDAVSPSPQAAMASVASVGHPYRDEGPELWSSKELNLLWLPRCDNWASPSIHRIAAADQPSAPQDGVHEWHWRIDLQFGSWATRAIHRADSAKADLPGGVRTAFSTIREYLEGFFPDCWARVNQLATAGPVKLNPIPDDFYHFARFGWCPRWGQPAGKGKPATGWYTWYESFCESRTAAVMALPAAPNYQTFAKTSAKRRAADDGLYRTTV